MPVFRFNCCSCDYDVTRPPIFSERKCLDPQMLGFPAMSTFRKSSAGAEVKRGYVRVATAVATKSAPPPPTEVPEREQEQEADTSAGAAAIESAMESDLLLEETAVEAAVPQEGDNFTAMEVDDTPEQVILTTEEALIHSEEGFPIHVETEPALSPDAAATEVTVTPA